MYFVNGMKFYEEYGMSDSTVDGCLLNDLGFKAMANIFIEALEKTGIF